MGTMTPHYKRIAQIKLKGKKSCLVGCGCCVAQNRKEEMLDIVIDEECRQEIDAFLEGGDIAQIN